MRLFTFLLMLILPVSLHAAPATYRIDPEHFSIAFMIGHLGYSKMIGQFTQASGEFIYDEQTQQLRSGAVEVRATSVSTHHEKRDKHLRSADFLNVQSHPLIRFTATDYKFEGDSGGLLRGELSLLGQTHPIELKVQLNKAAKYPFGHGKHTLGFSAATTLQRSHWGMKYGVADGMVSDTVELLFEFEALKQ